MHDRFFQFLLLVSLAAFSWLAMQAVHELGHVLHAGLSGGAVERVVLHPLDISRTDVSPNPHPLFVAWGGAAWGCSIPLALWAAVRWLARPREKGGQSPFAGTAQRRAPTRSVGRRTNGDCPLFSHAYLVRWFAGFCLIANGAYLAGGSFMPGGGEDAGVLLANGAAQWQLLAFGVPAVAAGLYLWHGLGPHFGLGPVRRKVDRRAAIGVSLALTFLVVLEVLLG
jgi:hypothetical protein